MLHSWKKTKRYKKLRIFLATFTQERRIQRKRIALSVEDFAKEIEKFLADKKQKS
jgi:hypothetical protein